MLPSHAQLARLLSPVSVAIVGASEESAMSNNAVLPMLDAGQAVVLVNPRRDRVYGQRAHRDLAAVGEPVDAVLSLVNAERSVDVVEEAAALGCGGVVVAAAGFAEAGEAGVELERRLRDVARRSGIAVVGPNCAGFRNVPLGISLFTGGRLELPVSGQSTIGGVSVVSQSGFLARAALAAAKERALGVSIAVSSGNEAVCDLADHVAVLAADPLTSVICLVIETVRRPVEFFAAVAQARVAGKPVIALKLGRSARARAIVQSHTGALADESWVYDLAFRERGIVAASDIDDLLDRAQLFVQLPRQRHRRMQRIGLISTSGGVAALATDLADEEGTPLPPLREIEAWVRQRVPGDTVNPLDLTGFVMTKSELMEEVFTTYAGAVDVLVLAWWAGADDEAWSRTMLQPFAEVAARTDVPFLVSPMEATAIGDWVADWRRRGLLFARGLRSVYRAVDALGRFAEAEVRDVPPAVARRSSPPSLIDSAAGPMVRFADAMDLLAAADIQVAPWAVLPDGVTDDPQVADLGESLVVKLADVPHRTELDAVRVGVARSELPAVVGELRSIAAAHDLPGAVAVQPLVSGHGEAFAGLHARTALGPVALLGLGGVLVEVGRQVSGRFLPLDEAAARALATEVAGPGALGGRRGQPPWPLDAVERVLHGLDRLWTRHGSWLDSVDLNPLIVSDRGLIAVDALLIAAPSR